MGRCRNIFINTNKLTPKLIMQLLESTSRCIAVFYQSKSRFAHCIHRNEVLSETFGNLQSRVLERYSNVNVAVSSPVPSTKHLESKLSRQKSRKRAITTEKVHKRKAKVAAVVVPHIRKPTIITRQQPSHYGAYEELYVKTQQLVTDAQHDLEDIANAYQQPLDYSMYHVADSQAADSGLPAADEDRVLDGEIPVLDWDTLTSDPALERYEAEESLRDQDRFESAYKKFRASVWIYVYVW